MYICPVCKLPVPGETRKLRWHLRVVHCLSDSQNYTLVCSQNGCQRTYHNLNSLSKHLSREHLSFHTSDLSDHTSARTTRNDIEADLISDTTVSNGATEYATNTDTCRGPSLTSYAATFVAQMYSAANTTLSDVQRSVTCTKELLDRTTYSLQQSTISLLRDLSISEDNEGVVSLMKKFESARNVFDDLDNPYKMTKYFESQYSLAK